MRGLLPAIKTVVTQSRMSIETPRWAVTRLTGEMNHRVYHCQSTRDEQLDLMVKVFEHTDQQWAWREYASLRALWNLGLTHVSPIPLLLLETYVTPDVDILITEWIGDASEPVIGKSLHKLQWTTILNTLAEVHRVTPGSTRVKLSDAFNRVDHPIDYLRRLQSDFSRIKMDSDENEVLDLLEKCLSQLEATLPHQWAFDIPQTLVHGDWHIHNFAFADGAVRFFDWETAGWSDPAIDIALLLSHESFFDVELNDKRWIIEMYQDIREDETLTQRVAVYCQLLDVEWLIDDLYRLMPTASSQNYDDVRSRMKRYQQRLERRYKR